METHLPLLKPFVWEVFGPGKYLENDQLGPLDGEGAPPAGDKRTWVPFLDANFDPFGILDFGLHTCGNSSNAPQYSTIYARTRIRVPHADTYAFKLQSDDQMLLWIDGKLAYRNDQRSPVTRNAHMVPIQLEAGEHSLRMRINQQDGPWQASLRIRTRADELSDVQGVE